MQSSQSSQTLQTPQAGTWDTYRITLTAMLIAIIILFNFTPIGAVYLGTIRMSIITIPVVIGLLSEGLATGVLLGAAFGCVSFISGWTLVPPSILYFCFRNPLVSILPRVLIPVAAYGVYQLALKLPVRSGHARDTVAYAAAGAAGALTNTALVLGMIRLIYAAPYAEALNITAAQVNGALMATVLTNGLPEAALATVLVAAVTNVLLPIAKRLRKQFNSTRKAKQPA